MSKPNKLTGKKIDLDENRYVAVSITPNGSFQINAQNKIVGRKWRTCKCKRVENDIVETSITFSQEGAIALCTLLLDELVKLKKVEIETRLKRKQ